MGIDILIRKRIWVRIHPRRHPCPPDSARDPHLPVPAVQHPLGIDERRRFWSAITCSSRNFPTATAILIPLSPPLFSGASWLGAERGDIVVFPCRPTELYRLHQARDRPARRPYPDAGRPALHQRQAGQARAAFRLHRRGPLRLRAPRGASAGRKRCRTASAMNRSIASTTASTTTPTSTPCPPATSS